MNPFRVPVIFIIFSPGDAQGYHNLSRWDKNITFSILLQLPLQKTKKIKQGVIMKFQKLFLIIFFMSLLASFAFSATFSNSVSPLKISKPFVRVGTWNMDYWEPHKLCGAKAKLPENMAEYIADANVDVLAMLEVSSSGTNKLGELTSASLDKVFSSLNKITSEEWKYRIFKNKTDFNLRVGIAWNEQKIEMVADYLVPVKHKVETPKMRLWVRPPHAIKFSVKNSSTEFIVIPIHHKSNREGDCSEKRYFESCELARAIPKIKEVLKNDNIIITGRIFENHSEIGATKYINAGLIDLNPDDKITAYNRMSLGRIYVSQGKPEFAKRNFDVLEKKWLDKNNLNYRDFRKLYSDYYLFSTDIIITNEIMI